MSSSTKAPDQVPTAVQVVVDAEWLRVSLTDGRELAVPLDWFPWLASSPPRDRSDFGIIEGGQGIWWEPLDEGLSVPGLLGLPHS
jgi:hypothetical protein